MIAGAPIFVTYHKSEEISAPPLNTKTRFKLPSVMHWFTQKQLIDQEFDVQFFAAARLG